MRSVCAQWDIKPHVHTWNQNLSPFVQVLNITTANRSSGIFYSKLMELAVYAFLSLENSL